MAAEYINVCVFKPHDIYAKLFRKSMSLLLLNIYEVVAIFKCLPTLKGRELVFKVLVRLLNCLCSSIKN